MIKRTVEIIMNLIRTREYVEFNQGDDRLIRKAISELSKEGIIFISVGKYSYKRIEIATDEEKSRYFNLIKSTLATTYYNRIIPIKHFLSDEQKKELYAFAELIKEEL